MYNFTLKKIQLQKDNLKKDNKYLFILNDY